MMSKDLDRTYDFWSEFYDEFDNPLIPIEEMAVRSLLRTIDFHHVLDAAAGTGRHAIYLTQQGKSVVAIDRNEKMLSKAREKALSKELVVEFRIADVSEIPFEPGSFDLVLCALALAHIKDLSKPCQEFVRVLRPGGNLIITDLHPFVQRELGPEHQWEIVEGQTPVFFPNYHASTGDYLEALELPEVEIVAVLDIPMKLHEELFPGALILWAKKCA